MKHNQTHTWSLFFTKLFADLELGAGTSVRGWVCPTAYKAGISRMYALLSLDLRGD